MASIQRDLILKLNKGTTFVIIGAGTSVDSGFPTWSGLAEQVIDKIKKESSLSGTEITRIESQLISNDIISVFENIERNVGKEKVVELIKEIFDSSRIRESEVYKYLCSWPIPVYLTTNYDDLLLTNLSSLGFSFIEKGNSLDDFRSLRHDSDGYIFKIHGDFKNPKMMVITKSDYDQLCGDTSFQYWRDKIFSVLNMMNVLIVGYSARDPNFIDQLERAKKIAHPDNPVYMFATDLDEHQISKLYSEHNIKIISYDNSSGNHAGLKRLLRHYSAFVCKRNSPLVGRAEVDHEEAEVASSIYFYNEVVFKNNKVIAKALYNVILNYLNDSPSGISDNDIRVRLNKNGVINDDSTISEALNELAETNYIIFTKENSNYYISESGKNIVTDARSRNSDVKLKFIKYCEIAIKSNDYPVVDSSKIIDTLNSALIHAFKRRGFEIARMVHEGSEILLNSSTDIVYEIEKCASPLSRDEFEVFTDIFIEMLQRPIKEVRDYFALLCNGYFCYHILGHDKRSRVIRLDELRKKRLVIDSSILIPLIAKDCINNKYANEIIECLLSNEIKLTITDRLLYEVIEHAEWALRNFKNIQIDDPEILKVALGIGYKQNLFIDGSLQWSLGKTMITFGDYMIECLGEYSEKSLHELIQTKLLQRSISIENMDDLQGFQPMHYSKFEELKEVIKQRRGEKGSYRNENQCETEAELVIISEIKPFNFLTHTKNLKEITSNRAILHWSPEIMYRFLSLNNCEYDLSNLYACMVEDFYNCGFNIVNTETLSAFTERIFYQSRVQLKKQRELSGERIEKYVNEQTILKHERDFTLSFFTMQTAFYEARKASEEKEYAEKRMKTMEIKKELLESERNDYLRMKSKKKERLRKARTKSQKKKKKK